MKSLKFFTLSILVLMTLSVKAQEQEKPFGIIIHGGAGYLVKENISEEKEKAYLDKLNEAIEAGYKILEKGGSSMEAIQKSICILEDSPLFNAGKGAVFTHKETNEMDASIMDGSNLNAGAVAGINFIKNPILAAAAVMEKSKHVMLSGMGAVEFAKEQGLETVSPDYFRVDSKLDYLRKVKEEENRKALDKTRGSIESKYPDKKFGTVGAAALDKNGNLAAGTSTGGMTNKRYGRIGDAPIIAAGTYADNNTCAVSCTGHGEYFIRNVVAYDVSARIKYNKQSLENAAKTAISETDKLGGKGGLIAIDKDGNIAYPFSTPGMHRAWKLSNGNKAVKMFGDVE